MTEEQSLRDGFADGPVSAHVKHRGGTRRNARGGAGKGPQGIYGDLDSGGRKRAAQKTG